MLKYEYMIIYSHPRGTGRICLTRDKEINSYNEIEQIDKTIYEHNGIQATVIDFKLLRIFEQ